MKAREHQQQALDALLAHWNNGGKDPLIEMATGTGKGPLTAMICQHLMTSYEGVRILCLVHVKELVAQNAQAILRLWPSAPIGINCASLGRRDTSQALLVASIQSVFKKPTALGFRDVVIIDEAHLVPKAGNGMYRQLIADLRAINPDIQVVGLTATPFRLDSGRLDEGEDKLFDKIVFRFDIGTALDAGWLAPLISKATALTLKVDGVAKRGGDFVESELQAAVDQADVTEAACDEIVQFANARDRRSWVVFCCGVAHSEHVRDAMRARGITCESVTGDTDATVRDSTIRRFRAGEIRCLTSVGVLTTGFDAPGVDLLCMLRPTLSVGLYIQIAGRGTRPVWPAGFNPDAADAADRIAAIAAGPKPNCLVLDFAGNFMRHGPVDDPELPGKKKAKAKIVLGKTCPKCESLVKLSCKECPDCGHVWETMAPEPKNTSSADSHSRVLSRELVDDWLAVRDTYYYRNAGKAGPDGMPKPDTLRVDYNVGMNQTYKEWITVLHEEGTFAGNKARKWWVNHGGKMDEYPAGIPDAEYCQVKLGRVISIRVFKDGDYWRVGSKRVAIGEQVWEVTAEGKRFLTTLTLVPECRMADEQADGLGSDPPARVDVLAAPPAKRIVSATDRDTNTKLYRAPVSSRWQADAADAEIPF